MNREQIISLFKNKPRHAGRQLESCTDIEDSPGISIPEKAYNYCYPGSAETYSSCLFCHKPFKNFISFNQGYRHYCSQQCSNASDLVKQHKKEGMLEKYGVENPMQSPEIRSRAQETNLKRYGAITPLRQDYVQEKVKSGLTSKYGVDHAFKIKSVMKAARDNKVINYAAEPWYARLEYIEKSSEVSLEELNRDHKGFDNLYKWKHKCGNIYDSPIISGSILACPNCKIKFRSAGEEELAAFIESQVTSILKNDREAVRPYELDVYCPSLNLAIEYNGLYWHSDEWKKPDYHLRKLLACEKKGIMLIQIFEDEWLNKKEIVKSRIAAIIGKSSRIYARKCTLRVVSPPDTTKFLDENHLQGACGASIRLGLYQDDSLIAMMTFGTPRFNKRHDWELLRFCTLRGTSVIGGASKLFSNFSKNHSGSIISYADRRWSAGELYKKLGMTQESASPPSYFYTRRGVRLNRISAQKHKLKDLLGNKFDYRLTEGENMKAAGFNRIYDCGHQVYTKLIVNKTLERI